ncbi:MAG: hypothetical protein ACOY0T_35550 [Myxococcota bacterium]
MTPIEAAKLVAMLAASFPAERWTDSTCRVFEASLEDLGYDIGRAAVQRIINTSRFPPSIAELRGAAADVGLGECRQGAEAWGDVGREIRRVGAYGEPNFADGHTAHAVDVLGWRNLCLGSGGEAADRARFIEIYDGSRAAERRAIIAEPGRLDKAIRALQFSPVMPARLHAAATDDGCGHGE